MSSADTPSKTDPPRRALLVGSGASVEQLRTQLSHAGAGVEAAGCMVVRDTDVTPVGGVIEAQRVDLVLVSLPLAMRAALHALTHQLARLGVEWRFMPTLADQLAGRANRLAAAPPSPRELQTGEGLDLAALIDRRPRPLDEHAIRDTLAGKVVMITGAGGSIGSELARVVGRFAPGKLILVERAENPLFEIDREIAHVYPDLRREAVLHDVTDVDQTLDLLERARPDVIFHAAAHKHVPMMEDHPSQALRNNFYGTRSIADAADACGVERFVMISTDKAVNPSSVMGATKRLAELYIQVLNARSRTIYSVVRFGNVLGSAGSVLTVWSDQLSRGGPVTVTHPEMTRYFMTIPEAAGLVLQAGSLSRGGEVFLLDMGEPVRILDLAERFVQAAGFEPGVDVEIRITGIRPGEKLFEVLAYGSEDMLPTVHESIRVWRTAPPETARMSQIVTTFDRLRDKTGDGSRLWRDASPDAIITALRSVLPEMVRAAAG